MKTRGDFHFKKFSISHDRSTHKVGTDGVLLGAWVNVTGANRILDIGTGSGVIALMLAQRTQDAVMIEAVELLETDAQQARENVNKSPWPTKIKVHHTRIQEFLNEDKYDLIVSNPPYFINSWLPPTENRSAARHTNDLNFNELLDSVERLLTRAGRFAVILPPNEAQILLDLAKTRGLQTARIMSFRSRPEKPVERLLIEFSFGSVAVVREELVLYSKAEAWTDEYRTLTRDFYLGA